MRKLLLSGMLLVCAGGAHAQANPALFRCKDQRHVIQLSINNTGQTVEGPACVEITFNALRYGADFGKTTTSSNGPNLTSVFPSSFSPGGADPKTITSASLEEKFQSDEQLRQILVAQLILVESKNRTTGSNLDKYLTTLRNLIVQTDDTFATGGATGVLADVNSPAVKTQMDAILASAVNWNTTDEIVTRLQQLQADLSALPFQFPTNTGTITADPCGPTNIKLLGWSDWSKCFDARYKLMQTGVASLLTEASPWTSDGDKAAQFAKKLGIVGYWKTEITALLAESFRRQAEVECGVLFNRNEQTVLKLILTDRTSIFDGQAPQPQTKDNLLTVACSSPFSLSAGAAFSTIHNQQFAIVKSAPSAGGTTSVNTFGVTADSRVNPYPIAMAHARLHNWSENRYALHFSFGVGANVKGQDSGGSSPEFLTGLSFSFLRTIYLTGGLDVGKQSRLIGGFKLGDTVPSDIASPPVSSSYKPGFGFAITFTKP
jgi:hypothetical protein